MTSRPLRLLKPELMRGRSLWAGASSLHGSGVALARSFTFRGRACTRELLSLPLEICYSTTFLLQSPSSSFLELGGQYPTECPSLSEQPPKDRMQIYYSLITQIHKVFSKQRELSWWGFIKKWLKPHFDPEISSDLLKIFVRKNIFYLKKYDVYWYLIKQIHSSLRPASALVKRSIFFFLNHFSKLARPSKPHCFNFS